MDIKQQLGSTTISITCYDRNGNLMKTVTSADDGAVEDPDTPSTEDGTSTSTGDDDLGGNVG